MRKICQNFDFRNKSTETTIRQERKPYGNQISCAPGNSQTHRGSVLYMHEVIRLSSYSTLFLEDKNLGLNHGMRQLKELMQ